MRSATAVYALLVTAAITPVFAAPAAGPPSAGGTKDVKGLQNSAENSPAPSWPGVDHQRRWTPIASSPPPISTCGWNCKRQDVQSEFQQLVDNALQQGLITEAEANALLQLAQAVQSPQELQELLNAILGEGVNALPAANSTLSEVPAATPTPSSSSTNSTSPSPSKRQHEDELQSANNSAYKRGLEDHVKHFASTVKGDAKHVASTVKGDAKHVASSVKSATKHVATDVKNAVKRDSEVDIQALANSATGNKPASAGTQLDLERGSAIGESAKRSTVSTLVNLLTGLASDLEGAIDGKTKRDLEGDVQSLLDKVEEYSQGLVAGSLFAKRAPLGVGTIVSILEGLAAGAGDALSGNSKRDIESDLENFVDTLKNEVHGITSKRSTVSTLVNLLTGLVSDIQNGKTKRAKIPTSTIVSILQGVAAGAEDALNGNSKRDLEGDLQSLVDGLKSDVDRLTTKRAPLGVGTIVSVLEGLAAGAEDALKDQGQSSKRDLKGDVQGVVDKLKNDVDGHLSRRSTVSTLVNLLTGLESDVEGTIDGYSKRSLLGDLQSLAEKLQNDREGTAKRSTVSTLVNLLTGLASDVEGALDGNSKRDLDVASSLTSLLTTSTKREASGASTVEALIEQAVQAGAITPDEGNALDALLPTYTPAQLQQVTTTLQTALQNSSSKRNLEDLD
ncbi:hypothetical protein EDD16DRAFT_1728603 [Pisolithus croceorrhizus]|nr:hypothetical protein EDD16DRAFT_1728603 [Pisolithus croceorrhizus]KAI6111897.1 hypothetical protein EV401DRAFT_2211849 [Pisolithus croceorrhizus]KAI6163946.1 hypothetical protein EDD17DRAFT_406241 [Pisolithus thermaeus]